MTFKAKYRSPCDDCEDDIMPGQEAEFVGVGAERRVVHTVCPDDTVGFGFHADRPRPVCPHCFLVLPTGGDPCECRQ